MAIIDPLSVVFHYPSAPEFFTELTPPASTLFRERRRLNSTAFQCSQLQGGAGRRAAFLPLTSPRTADLYYFSDLRLESWTDWPSVPVVKPGLIMSRFSS